MACLRAALAAALLAVVPFGLALPAAAQEVRLEKNGREIVRGALLGFDGRFYRVLGPYGEVTVDGAALTCRGEACAAPPPLFRISGEAAPVETILPPLLESFARRRGYGLDIERNGARRIYRFDSGGVPVGGVALHATTSAEGFADIVADVADLAVTLRPPSAEEAEIAREAGRGRLAQPGRSAILALDALVPVVAVTNPVERITMRTLTDVAVGRIDNWAALGGPDRRLALHLPDPGTGAGEALRRHVPLAYRSGRAILHDTPEAVSSAVATDRAAFGLTLFSAIGDGEVLDLAGPCGARVAATTLSIKTEDYPLTVPLFFYAPERRLAGLARDFVDYATSPAAQPVIRRAGRVDQFPQAIPFAAQGARLGLAVLNAGSDVSFAQLRDMVAELAPLTRLSLSFRFENGAARLDAQSTANVALLAEALRGNLFDGRRLIFAGFSDGDGPAGVNLDLSRRRAQAVRDAVSAAAPEIAATLDIAAYGEALPMACDQTRWGQKVNRRVEVWLE